MRTLSKYIVFLAGTKSESLLHNDDVIQIENVFKTGNGDIAFNYIKNEHSYIGFYDSHQSSIFKSQNFLEPGACHPVASSSSEYCKLQRLQFSATISFEDSSLIFQAAYSTNQKDSGSSKNYIWSKDGDTYRRWDSNDTDLYHGNVDGISPWRRLDGDTAHAIFINSEEEVNLENFQSERSSRLPGVMWTFRSGSPDLQIELEIFKLDMSTASQVLSTGKDWISQSNGQKIIELPDRLLVFFNEKNEPMRGKNKNQPMSIRPMVGQVCKNDLGGGSKSGGRMRKYFSTFVKNHLTCGAAYTVLVDIQLISQSKAEDPSVLIGLFKSADNSVPGSAFCIFKTDSILAQFSMDQSEDRIKKRFLKVASDCSADGQERQKSWSSEILEKMLNPSFHEADSDWSAIGQSEPIYRFHGTEYGEVITAFVTTNQISDSDKINIYYGTSLGRVSKLEFDSEVKSQSDLIEKPIDIDFNENCKTDYPEVKQMILDGTDLIVSFESLIVTKGLQCEICRDTQSNCNEKCENKFVFPEWCEYYPELNNRNPKPKTPIALKSPRSSPTPTPPLEDNDESFTESSSRSSTSPNSDFYEPASVANQNPEPWYKKQKFIWALIAGSIGIVIGILIGGLGCCAVANSKKKYKETKKSRLASESSGNMGKESNGSGQHDWGGEGYSTSKRNDRLDQPGSDSSAHSKAPLLKSHSNDSEKMEPYLQYSSGTIDRKLKSTHMTLPSPSADAPTPGFATIERNPEAARKLRERTDSNQMGGQPRRPSSLKLGHPIGLTPVEVSSPIDGRDFSGTLGHKPSNTPYPKTPSYSAFQYSNQNDYSQRATLPMNH